MKDGKVKLGIFLVLLLLGLFQASRLIEIRAYNENFYTEKNNESKIEANEFLNLIKNEEAEVIAIKNDKNWKGEVIFKGNEEKLRSYINNLKINNIYVENYKIEKIGELKWFLEIKPV